MSDFDIDEKLKKIRKKKPKIPKQRLREVYDKILKRVKFMKPDISTDKQKQNAYNRLSDSIDAGFPVSFCPDCPYLTRSYHELRRHLRNKHGWGAKDLNIFRQAFWAAKRHQKLDYYPQLS